MADGRKNNGGARPNAGRKPEKDAEELKRVLDEAVPFEERVDTFRVLAARSRSGDVGASKLLLGYLYGTPIQRMQDENGGAIIRVIRVEDDRPASEETTPRAKKDS